MRRYSDEERDQLINWLWKAMEGVDELRRIGYGADFLKDAEEYLNDLDRREKGGE